MGRRDIQEVGEDLASLFNSSDTALPGNAPQQIMKVVAKLVHSVYKSADSRRAGKERGDFAKGREQMAMHAIALLVDAKDWKQIERILFGDSNGD